MYAAKDPYVVMRRRNAFLWDVAKRPEEVSCSVAKSVRNGFGRLSIRQIKVLARSMDKSESILIKELIRCDVPGIANAFNV